MQAWSKISRMPAQGIKKLQDELLVKMINQELAVRHPYYRELFKDKGIEPASIRGTADLPNLPFTVKEDMLGEGDPQHPKKFVLEPPASGDKKSKGGGLRGLFGKKEEDAGFDRYRLAGLHYTAGRVSKPVPLVCTEYDLQNCKEAGVRAFDIFGLTRDDTVVNAFSYVPNASFWQMFYSTMELGATALQTGGGRVLGMEKILRALNNMEAPVFASFPGYAQACLQTLDYFGFSMSSLERIIIGNDFAPMEQVERLRELMKEVGAAGDRVQRIYFIAEAKSGWAECEPGHGYHTNPDHVLVEIVDPQTGAVKGEGEAGEVVITHLDARGTVLLRFRTGDIATGGITNEPCPNCGRTVPRILGDIERTAHYYELRTEDGVLPFNAYDLHRYMLGRRDVILWYAEITASGNSDGLKVVVRGNKGIDEKALTASLEQEIGERFKVPVTVETGSLDSLINTIGLEKNVTDQRIFDRRS